MRTGTEARIQAMTTCIETVTTAGDHRTVILRRLLFLAFSFCEHQNCIKAQCPTSQIISEARNLFHCPLQSQNRYLRRLPQRLVENRFLPSFLSWRPTQSWRCKGGRESQMSLRRLRLATARTREPSLSLITVDGTTACGFVNARGLQPRVAGAGTGGFALNGDAGCSSEVQVVGLRSHEAAG